MTTVIEIDPGLSGALGVLKLDGTLSVTDMPTVTIEQNGREKREVDPAALSAIVRGLPPGAIVWLERVGAMPGQSVSSMFAFGRAVGVVEGVLAASGESRSATSRQRPGNERWRCLPARMVPGSAPLSFCPRVPRNGGGQRTTAELRPR
ncbi:MAG: hypothetical protein FJX57_02590 [Alphaproteobacteria bacterium]|nr:hypothetical protein [Alphaproteobacteria bacterium]